MSNIQKLYQRLGKFKYWRILAVTLLCATGICLFQPSLATAATVQNPQNGSIGLEGTINGAPPSTAPTITTPSGGQSFTSGPITVAGLCQNGLLVKVFDNNVFVGSATCASGSFSLKVDLFNGANDLVARLYDALDRSGPDSATVTVNFTSAQFVSFGTLLSLTSPYAERGANPGQQLAWPIVINGGIGPYAVSVDWGDGSQQSLLSESFSGTINITHTYSAAGSYTIIVQATDKNGETAFLQLVGIANGAASQNSTNSQNTKTNTKIIWWPAAIFLPLIIIAFWLGRRHELFTIRKRLDQSGR